MSEEATVTMTCDDAVAVVRLVNGALTFLTEGMRHRLEQIALELADRDDVRAIVLTSGSPRSLSVGSDIKAFPDDVDQGRSVSRQEHAAYGTLASVPQPVVAVVRGTTLGGGLELALVADVRVAEQSATMGFPEVRIGVFASGGGTQRLPSLIGAGRAADLLLTGRTIDAATAELWGLVSRVVPDGAGEESARELARALASLPRRGVRATKRCIAIGLADGPAAGHDAEIEAIAELYTSLDAREGREAFLARRPPVFRHR